MQNRPKDVDQQQQQRQLRRHRWRQQRWRQQRRRQQRRANLRKKRKRRWCQQKKFRSCPEIRSNWNLGAIPKQKIIPEFGSDPSFSVEDFNLVKPLGSQPKELWWFGGGERRERESKRERSYFFLLLSSFWVAATNQPLRCRAKAELSFLFSQSFRARFCLKMHSSNFFLAKFLLRKVFSLH